MKHLSGFLLSDEDVLRVAALTLAGLERISRLNGTAPAAYTCLVEDLQRAAGDAGRRLQRDSKRRETRTSQASPGTTLRPDSPDGPSSRPWLSVKDAAAISGFDESYVRRRCRQGALVVKRSCKGAWLIEPDSAAVDLGSKTNRSAA